MDGWIKETTSKFQKREKENKREKKTQKRKWSRNKIILNDIQLCYFHTICLCRTLSLCELLYMSPCIRHSVCLLKSQCQRHRWNTNVCIFSAACTICFLFSDEIKWKWKPRKDGGTLNSEQESLQYILRQLNMNYIDAIQPCDKWYGEFLQVFGICLHHISLRYALDCTLFMNVWS